MMRNWDRLMKGTLFLLLGLASCGKLQNGRAAQNPDGQTGVSPGPAGLFGKDHRVELTWLGEPNEPGPGDYGRILFHNERKRYYEAHVPESYKPNQPLPVVLVLHGGGGFAAVMRYISGMDQLAEEENFLVVYPAGTNPVFFDKFLFWNTGQPHRNPKLDKIDDVGYIEAVLDDMQRYFAVDRKRVYATGISNGALMCYRLGVELSEKITAIAPVAGQRSVEQFEKRPNRPVPIIHFHGKQDIWLRYIGGQGRERKTVFQRIVHPPVEKAIQSWAELYNCSAEPEIQRNEQWQVFHYSGCEESAAVVLWAFEEGGHTWPGGKATRFEKRHGVGHVVKDVSASKTMWHFFEKFSLPN